MKLARPRSAEWQGEIAVSRTSAHFSDAKDTLADRSDPDCGIETAASGGGHVGLAGEVKRSPAPFIPAPAEPLDLCYAADRRRSSKSGLNASYAASISPES